MQELFKGSRRKDITLKPIALAVALALLNGGSLAASMSDVVSTRRAQSIGDQYGRDSLYASSPDDRRFGSEQNPTNSSWFSRSVKADRPETLGKTASLALHDSAHSVNLLPGNRPQAYGRAGGYVGWERIAMMQSLQDTVASSAFRGKNMVKNGPDALAVGGASTSYAAVTFTPIGTPTWEPVDVHLFSAPVGTAPNYPGFAQTTGALLPPPNHQPHPDLGIGPGVAHPPPYDKGT